MRAAWWWIDRWRKSTAYTDMTLAEQGAYRNLLDELWLRDGTLPNDERILAKMCGDATQWPNVRKAVLAHFEVSRAGLRNAVHDQVAKESHRRAEKQRRYRERVGNGDGNASGNGGGNYVTPVTRSPDQSPDQAKKTPTGQDPTVGTGLVERGLGHRDLD